MPLFWHNPWLTDAVAYNPVQQIKLFYMLSRTMVTTKLIAPWDLKNKCVSYKFTALVTIAMPDRCQHGHLTRIVFNCVQSQGPGMLNYILVPVHSTGPHLWLWFTDHINTVAVSYSCFSHYRPCSFYSSASTVRNNLTCELKDDHIGRIQFKAAFKTSLAFS